MKKIVHICLSGIVTDNFLYQDNLLSKYHSKMGLKVHFITSQLSFNTKGEVSVNPNSNYINHDGVEFHRLEMRGKQKLNLRLKRFTGLQDTLKSIDPDIIFIHGPQFLDMTKVKEYLKINKKNIKVYLDSHADFSNSAKNFFSYHILHRVLWRYMTKIISPYCERIYGVLPSRVDFLRSVYNAPESKLKLLVMGADDDIIGKLESQNSNETIRKKFNIPKTDFLIVTGGKIDEYKWQTLNLMDAINQLSFDTFHLIIFGSVDKSLKKEFNKLKNGNIYYAGWLDAIESYQYFDSADLVIFPGRHSIYWEQVVGQQKPLICKKWEGIDHIDIGGNVEFLETDNIDEIKNILQKIKDKPEFFDKMKKSAKHKSSYRFRYSKIAEDSLK